MANDSMNPLKFRPVHVPPEIFRKLQTRSVSLYIFSFVFVLIFWAIALDFVLLCVSTDLGKVTLTL